MTTTKIASELVRIARELMAAHSYGLMKVSPEGVTITQTIVTTSSDDVNTSKANISKASREVTERVNRDAKKIQTFSMVSPSALAEERKVVVEDVGEDDEVRVIASVFFPKANIQNPDSDNMWYKSANDFAGWIRKNTDY